MNPLDLVPFLLIAGIIYFLILRPQMQERSAHEALLGSLVRGDRVVTSSGIHGKILEVRDDTVVVEISEKTRVTLDKQHVAKKAEPAAAPTGS